VNNELWQVKSIRSWMGEPLRHTSYFTSKESVNVYGDWCKKRNIEVVSVAKYVLESEQ
jgi:hypothetical protein